MKQPKYKKLTKIKKVSKIPTRILGFNRPKWNLIKQTLKRIFEAKEKRKSKTRRKYRRFVKLITFQKILIRRKKMLYLNNAYKSLVETIRKAKVENYNLSNGKHKSNQKNFVKTLFLKNYYYCFDLVFEIYFSRSLKESQKLMQSKQLILNNKLLTKNKQLRKGDIIHINDSNFTYLGNKKLFLERTKVISFLQVDHYLQKVIITKSFANLGFNDFYLMIRNYLDTRTL
jgi:hypothetical protein